MGAGVFDRRGILAVRLYDGALCTDGERDRYSHGQLRRVTRVSAIG
jgi:hypothetical protein